MQQLLALFEIRTDDKPIDSCCVSICRIGHKWEIPRASYNLVRHKIQQKARYLCPPCFSFLLSGSILISASGGAVTVIETPDKSISNSFFPAPFRITICAAASVLTRRTLAVF